MDTSGSRFPALEWRSPLTSIDIVSLITNLRYVISIGIFLLGSYRAITIGRALVSRVYRNRAFWTAAVMIVFAITGFLDLTSLPSSIAVNTIGDILGILPYVAEILLLFAFIDGTILAGMETDFFHRDTLKWRSGRKPLYAAFVVSVAAVYYVFSLPNPNSLPFLAVASVYAGLAVILAIFGFSAATIIVVSRRTPDRTMKMFLRFLGYALGVFVLDNLMSSVFSGDVVTLLDDLLSLVAAYLVYRAVMFLSPLGRVEKVVAATSAPAGAPTQTAKGPARALRCS
jgi:hypothetical protein